MDNIILIGMPGSGKSTVGVVLAKILGYEFLDSDLEIQKRYKKRLSDIIEMEGNDTFIQIENKVNQSLSPERTVIATGGSAVYGREAMEHFQKIGTIIYLKLSYDDLVRRLGDLRKRGVVLKKGQTLLELYEERVPLYEKYASVIIDEQNKDIQQVALAIQEIFDE